MLDDRYGRAETEKDWVGLGECAILLGGGGNLQDYRSLFYRATTRLEAPNAGLCVQKGHPGFEMARRPATHFASRCGNIGELP